MFIHFDLRAAAPGGRVINLPAATNGFAGFAKSPESSAAIAVIRPFFGSPTRSCGGISPDGTIKDGTS